MSKLKSASEAVKLIEDGAVITVSSSSGLGCPDLVLKAIGERFETEGHPRDLTTLHPIAAGDMYGIKGVDHLAKDGLLKRILAGSYPSGPSSLPMPDIWEMIVNDRVQAYNVPSGILFDMHRDVAARKPGVMTRVGLDTFVDPQHEGCAMTPSAAGNPIVTRLQLQGETWLHFGNIVPDVAIVRGTTSDESGNITFEHEGALLGGLDQAIAVRNHGGLIIAQVKRLAAAGSLRPHDVHIPGNLVDVIVVDPEQRQTTETEYDPAISGELMRPWTSFEPAEYSLEKVIARRAAMELKLGQAANLGFGISANVPRILLEENYPKAITWAIEQGAVGGVPLTGFAFGCASNADSILSSADQFVYFQGGGFDISFLSFLEVDREGNVNVSKLGKKPYLTAGCGGFVDITAHARKIVFSGFFEVGAKLEFDETGVRVEVPGKSSKMVEKVEQITFSGKRARELGQDILYVTERCVMRPGPEGLVATEIMPGIDPERDIVAASRGCVSIDPAAREMSRQLLATGTMGLQL